MVREGLYGERGIIWKAEEGLYGRQNHGKVTIRVRTLTRE